MGGLFTEVQTDAQSVGYHIYLTQNKTAEIERADRISAAQDTPIIAAA